LLGISRVQRALAGFGVLQVLDIGQGTAQASVLRRAHVAHTSAQTVDDALIDVLVRVERNHGTARPEAYRLAMRWTNSSSARNSASTSSWLS
jgi:hypothetical protein